MIASLFRRFLLVGSLLKSLSMQLILLAQNPFEAKLLPDDGAAGDRFGISVGIDSELIVVGGQFDSDSGTFSGAA